MKMKKIIYLFLLLGLFACEKEETTPESNATIIEGKWQIDHIYHDDILVNSGASIKDRHMLEFLSDHTYKQTFFDDDSAYEGTWLLSDDDKTLTIVDHKGTTQVYEVPLVTNDKLQLSVTSKNSYVYKEEFSKM